MEPRTIDTKQGYLLSHTAKPQLVLSFIYLFVLCVWGGVCVFVYMVGVVYDMCMWSQSECQGFTVTPHPIQVPLPPDLELLSFVGLSDLAASISCSVGVTGISW